MLISKLGRCTILELWVFCLLVDFSPKRVNVIRMIKYRVNQGLILGNFWCQKMLILEHFSFFWLNPQKDKKIISWILCIWKKFCLQKVGVSKRFFIVKKCFLFFDLTHFWPCSGTSGEFTKKLTREFSILISWFYQFWSQILKICLLDLGKATLQMFLS